MAASQTPTIEESIARSALSHLYGHPLALDLPAARPGFARRRTPIRHRLPALRATLAHPRANRSAVAEAGGCG